MGVRAITDSLAIANHADALLILIASGGYFTAALLSGRLNKYEIGRASSVPRMSRTVAVTTANACAPPAAGQDRPGAGAVKIRLRKVSRAVRDTG